jgi:hypothetical protein
MSRRHHVRHERSEAVLAHILEMEASRESNAPQQSMVDGEVETSDSSDTGATELPQSE